jgi:hypothetical protein
LFAEDEALEEVGPLGGSPTPVGSGGWSCAAGFLYADVVSDGDYGRMGWFLGPDPLGFGVPVSLCGVSEGDIVEVDEDFSFPLPIPYLSPCVSRVVEDSVHSTLGPLCTRTMWIAFWIIG